MAKLKFIPGEKKLIGTKFGLNLRYDNVPTVSGRIPLLKDLGAQLLYYFTLNATNPQDTVRLQQAADTAKDLGLPIGVLVALEVPEIQTGLLKWLDTLKAILNPAFYGGGAETVNVTHYPQISNDDLINYTQQGIAYTGLPWIDDSALIQKEAEVLRNGIKIPNVDMARNLALAAVTKPGDQLRQYIQVSPEPGTGCVFTADQTDNYKQIRNFYDVTFLARQAAFQARFPGCVEAITQDHDEDAGTKKLSDPLANYSLGERLRMYLSNTEYYSMVLWMAENNLVTRDNKPEREYTTLKRFMPAFKFRYVMPLEIKIDGCRGVGLSDGVDSHGAIITNDTSVEQPVPASEIKYFGKKIPNAFKRDSGFADSWTGAVSNEVVAETQILLRKNSTNFITFSTAGSPVT